MYTNYDVIKYVTQGVIDENECVVNEEVEPFLSNQILNNLCFDPTDHIDDEHWDALKDTLKSNTEWHMKMCHGTKPFEHDGFIATGRYDMGDRYKMDLICYLTNEQKLIICNRDADDRIIKSEIIMDWNDIYNGIELKHTAFKRIDYYKHMNEVYAIGFKFSHVSTEMSQNLLGTGLNYGIKIGYYTTHIKGNNYKDISKKYRNDTHAVKHEEFERWCMHYPSLD